MMAINRGVRVGAAAFALGLSLAGPQAVGVAAADGGDADSSSVSAGQPDTSGHAARVSIDSLKEDLLPHLQKCAAQIEHDLSGYFPDLGH